MLPTRIAGIEMTLARGADQRARSANVTITGKGTIDGDGPDLVEILLGSARHL